MSASPPRATKYWQRNKTMRCANSVLTHCSKRHRYSITSSAMASSGEADGHPGRVAGAQVGGGYPSLPPAFSGVIGSPPHRAIMLLKRPSRPAIAAAYAPKTKYKGCWAMTLADPDERRG